MTKTKSKLIGNVLALSSLALLACGKSDKEDHYNIILTNDTVPHSPHLPS